MFKYRLILSAEADQDLNALYQEGYRKWGEEQADKYYDDVIRHFDVLRIVDLVFLYNIPDQTY